MTIKLKQDSLNRAIKRYIESLLPGSTVGEIIYHRKTKAKDSVLVEAEITTTEETE